MPFPVSMVMLLFQSTRPVQGATRTDRHRDCVRLYISIHAPRAGRDAACRCAAPGQSDFNPRAPCRARPDWCAGKNIPRSFQSTRPVQGATAPKPKPPPPLMNFNPRAPCRARPVRAVRFAVFFRISIHAPRAGRDILQRSGRRSQSYFNPRAPCRARLKGASAVRLNLISIHAPRAGRDQLGQ